MKKPTVLICDDDTPMTIKALDDMESDFRHSGFNVKWFHGRDSNDDSIEDKSTFFQALLPHLKGCDLLVMDLGWWTETGLTADFFGIDILEMLLPNFFLADKVVVRTKYDTERDELRIIALGIPKKHIFKKHNLHDPDWLNFIVDLRAA